MDEAAIHQNPQAVCLSARTKPELLEQSRLNVFVYVH